MEQNEKILYAGYAENIMTPPRGLKIPGYFSVREATGVINDLKVRAVAFSNGSEQAVFFLCECLNVHDQAYEEIKAKIGDRCGINPENVYIAGNHSHTACYVASTTTKGEIEQIYAARLQQILCDTAQFALEDLKPATMKIARGKAEGVGFIRRYRMKDGTVKTNPPTGSPDILHFEGEQDHSLQMVRILREGAKEIVLLNFGTHADVIGGTKFCSDYTGFVTEYMKGALEDKAEVICFVGAQGDSNHCNRFLPKGTLMKGLPVSQRMARIITGEALKIYDDATPIGGTEIEAKRLTVKVGQNAYDPADVPEAKEIHKLYHELKTSADPIFKQYKLNVPEALRIVANLSNPEFFEIPLTAIRVGDLVFGGVPGEPFQQIGRNVKEHSPFKMTFVTCCTNGSHGYFPTEEAFAEKGYERSTSRFASNCANIISDGLTEAINELYKNTQE